MLAPFQLFHPNVLKPSARGVTVHGFFVLRLNNPGCREKVLGYSVLSLSITGLMGVLLALGRGNLGVKTHGGLFWTNISA